MLSPVRVLQETCPYLSRYALSRVCRSMDGQQQQEGFTKLLLESWDFFPHNARHNYANFFFSVRTTQNNGFNICPHLQQVFCMQIRCDFRDGEAECLLHPSFVARRIKGDLLWFVNMRAFDSDWNETMCRIRLKTMCGDWRLGHVLDFTSPCTRSSLWSHCLAQHLLWSGFLSCFCSVMGYNNLYKSQWLSRSSTVWAWHWWKAWFSRGPVSRKSCVYWGKVWKSAGFRFDSVVLLWRGISLRFYSGEQGQI